ncbi:MAG: DNA primase, partial [Clostridiales bacterium]
MAKYKREVTEYIKDRVDIIDVIGSSVSLKKTGRNYKGLCPFHSEKTPSFVVSQERQFYHCFGCGKSGSIFNYVMETENVDFLDALESLAERYGIDLTPFIESDQGRQKYDNRQRLYDVMQSAARYYFKQLGGSQVARQYLQGRQLSDATARHFGLGYAPDGWQNIIEFAERAGFTRRELLDCGLILKNEQSRYYDRFRNRLMFPIFDRRGRVVAFGGRVLDDGLPKYLNSPETTIFHKSNVLYGLNFAKKRINKEKSVILVEGYMDVIAL